MPEYRVTFGQQYGRDDHPRLTHIAHPDGWLTIVADDLNRAREITVAMVGRFWSNIYDPANPHDADTEWDVLFPRGELLRVIDPAMSSPVAVYTRDQKLGHSCSSQQLLVTLWADHTPTVASRPDSSATWGPPHDLDTGAGTVVW